LFDIYSAGELQPITLTTEERALLRAGLRRLADERAKPLPSFFRREGLEPPGYCSEVNGEGLRGEIHVVIELRVSWN